VLVVLVVVLAVLLAVADLPVPVALVFFTFFIKDKLWQ